MFNKFWHGAFIQNSITWVHHYAFVFAACISYLMQVYKNRTCNNAIPILAIKRFDMKQNTFNCKGNTIFCISFPTWLVILKTNITTNIVTTMRTTFRLHFVETNIVKRAMTDNFVDVTTSTNLDGNDKLSHRRIVTIFRINVIKVYNFKK